MKNILYKKYFLTDEGGNVSILFAMSLTMILIMVGVAVDFTSKVQSKTKYQDSTDAAVLAAVSSGETSQKKLLEVAELWIDHSIQERNIEELNVELSMDGSEVTVKLSAPHENFFMGIFGHKNSNISVESVSLIPGHVNKNIAFVLDTTQSMEGSKLSTLRSAMSDFIEVMEPALSADDAKISIVPFSEYVRIPLINASESWINVQPPEEITYNVLDGANSVNCRTEGTGEGKYTVCDSYVYIEESTTTAWKGCMGSRPNDFHKIADYQSRPLPAFNGSRAECHDSMNFVLPLTSDVTALENSVASLKAHGFTYIPAGLIWGWRALSPNEPFTEAFTSTEEAAETENLLVLMTDGSNSKNLDNSVYDGTVYHWGAANSATEGYEAINAAIANPLTEELCDLIKAENIEIATIAYEVSDTDALNILRACASTPSNFYDAQNANGLKQAFKDIGAGNSEIRLVR